ncbi:hypothetical protein [Bradyrhizobium sp. STM 3809]|uniref:hypothetical protein n=1 Tax=Bradyrhizobium sp. STM 3809 TaxID=551936 RepID=UPI001112611F|nr:hypothetical protein [Bradyrhizobium sp. STM 3809]
MKPKQEHDGNLWRSVDWRMIDSIFDVSERSLSALALAAGHDPATFFRGRNFLGIPLDGIDVRGIDFTEADLRGTNIGKATIDETTILINARLDDQDRLEVKRIIRRQANLLLLDQLTPEEFDEFHKVWKRFSTKPPSTQIEEAPEAAGTNPQVLSKKTLASLRRKIQLGELSVDDAWALHEELGKFLEKSLATEKKYLEERLKTLQVSTPSTNKRPRTSKRPLQ